jgi:hypothetical protein
MIQQGEKKVTLSRTWVYQYSRTKKLVMIGVGSYYLSFFLSPTFNTYPLLLALRHAMHSVQRGKRGQYRSYYPSPCVHILLYGAVQPPVGNQTATFGILGLLTDREIGSF